MPIIKLYLFLTHQGSTVGIVRLSGTGTIHRRTGELAQINKPFTYSYMSDRAQGQVPQKVNVDPCPHG
jgi:hypothetical protein